MPVEGDSVVIPQGQTIILDVSPPRLYLLLVRGMLVFDRKVRISVSSVDIFVKSPRICQIQGSMFIDSLC